jgi:hypothetical protein
MMFDISHNLRQEFESAAPAPELALRRENLKPHVDDNHQQPPSTPSQFPCKLYFVLALILTHSLTPILTVPTRSGRAQSASEPGHTGAKSASPASAKRGFRL